MKKFSITQLKIDQSFLFDKKVLSPLIIKQFVEKCLNKEGKEILVESCSFIPFRVLPEYYLFCKEQGHVECFFSGFSLAWVLRVNIDNLPCLVAYSIYNSKMYLFLDAEGKENPLDMGIFKQKRISLWTIMFNRVGWLFYKRKSFYRCPGGCSFEIYMRYSRVFKIKGDSLVAVEDILRKYSKPYDSDKDYSFWYQEEYEPLYLSSDL